MPTRATTTSAYPLPNINNQGGSSGANAHSGHGGGLRTHLLHLLPPRHALFHARVTIHELANVPLISGEFAAKWRFKHVHTKVKAQTHSVPSNSSNANIGANGNGKSKWKGKGKALEPDHVGLHSQGSVADASSDDVSFRSNSNRSGGDGVSLSGNSNGNAGKTSTGSANRNGVGASGANTRGTVHDYGAYVPPASPLFGQKFDTSSTAANGSSSGSGSATRPDTPVNSNGMDANFESAGARGMTEYAKLTAHKAKWEHTVDVALQMDIARDTGDLQMNEMKVTIMQNVIAGDPDAPENPRMGHVYVNLAEYVDEGPVTRQFLLRDNKTNATLKMTIEISHIGGDPSYTKPPLRKGEIMAGVAHILEADSLAAALGLPTPGLSTFPHGRSRDAADLPRVQHFRSRADRMSVHYDLRNVGLQPAPDKHTTENLIEAIFNPVPTTAAKASPFTYFVPAQALLDGDSFVDGGEGEGDGDGDGDGVDVQAERRAMNAATAVKRTLGRLRGTPIEEADEEPFPSPLKSEFSANASLKPPSEHSERARTSYESSRSSATDQRQLDAAGDGGAGKKRHWWNKMGSSRPGTPANASVPGASASAGERPKTPAGVVGVARPKTPSVRSNTPANGHARIGSGSGTGSASARPRTPSSGTNGSGGERVGGKHVPPVLALHMPKPQIPVRSSSLDSTASTNSTVSQSTAGR